MFQKNLTQSQRIKYLNKHKHLCGAESGKTLTLFDPHPEYWLASDIIELYCADKINFQDYDNISYFTHSILPNIFDYTPLQKVSANTAIKNHALECPEIKNTKLSRYAVYCIVNKYFPDNTSDLVYLISPNTTTLNTILADALKFKRIDLREKLKESEKIFSRMAKYNNIPYNKAQQTLQQSLFGGLTITQIKDLYNIPENKPLADYMGAWAISAKINTIYNISRLSYAPNFCFVIQSNANKQRKQILSQAGQLPENDIHQQSVKQVAAEFRKKKQEFLEQCTHEHLY